jgi:hypothetical protein
MSTKGSFPWRYICQGTKVTIHLQLVPGLSKSQVTPSLSHMPLYNAQGQPYVYAPLYLTLSIRAEYMYSAASHTGCLDGVLTLLMLALHTVHMREMRA